MVMFMMALGFVLIRAHMHRTAGLVQEHVDRSILRRGTLYSVALGPVAYAIGASLAWINVIAAFVCYAVIALYFVLPHSTRARR